MALQILTNDDEVENWRLSSFLLAVGIVLGILKKKLLKTSNTVLMHSNSITRHLSPMFHAKSLLPRLDKLLPVTSWLKYFYQCKQYMKAIVLLFGPARLRYTTAFANKAWVPKIK